MASRQAVTRWLLEGDASIRWQVMRHLTHEPAEVVAAERTRVASEGWGAQLPGLQPPEGHWGDDTRHGWMTSTDALQVLKDLGTDPASEKARTAIGLVEDRITWFMLDGQPPFFDGETEACINGRILAAGAYFGASCDRLLRPIIYRPEQLPPPSTQNLEQCGWHSLTAPSANMPPCARAASASVAPISNA